MQNLKLQFKIQKVKNIFHLLKAFVANVVYGFPSRKIKVIGVTGTDGKTTTTHLIYHILKTSGKKVSMISTIYAKVGDLTYETGLHTTTPDSFLIQKLLRLAVNQCDEYFVLETTSHSLDQNRVWGIRYRVAVITNITYEHLDYHDDYENYLETKVRLLLNSEKVIINSDDERSFSTLKKILEVNGKSYSTFGLTKKTDFMTNYNQKLGLNLTKYNLSNYLAASAVISLLKIDEKYILNAIKSFSLPEGRLDVVYDREFKIIIDFAHTPNGIEELLNSVKTNLKNKGRIIHVFGSAGLRDTGKRPLMGIASSRYAYRIILTEEDYRTEDPYKICEQISEGIDKGFVKVSDLNKDQIKMYTIIIDRDKAISKAIKVAKSGDTILITGKGHEASLCRGKKEFPWSDKETIKKYVK